MLGIAISPVKPRDRFVAKSDWKTSATASRFRRADMITATFRGIRSDLAAILDHLKENGMRETVAWLRSTDAPVTAQFGKYALSGVASTVIQIGLFTWLSHTWFPAHDYLVEGGLPDELKERNAIISNLIAFPFSNLSAYLLNVWFVFTPGRHNKWLEFLLFTLISFVSFGSGLFGGPLLISRGLNPWIAQFGFMITSALVNFVCRKFLVFAK